MSPKCSVEGCARVPASAGWCQKHRHLRPWPECKRDGCAQPAAFKQGGYCPEHRTCRIDGCGLRAIADGMCNMHRKRAERGIPMDAPMPSPRGGPCPGPGDDGPCGRPVADIGYCQWHARMIRAGEELRILRKWGQKCAHIDCDTKVYAKSLCHQHWAELTGRPVPEKKPRASKKPKAKPGTCTFDGCSRPVYAVGLCKAHRRQQREGLPLTKITGRQPAKPKPKPKPKPAPQPVDPWIPGSRTDLHTGRVRPGKAVTAGVRDVGPVEALSAATVRTAQSKLTRWGHADLLDMLGIVPGDERVLMEAAS